MTLFDKHRTIIENAVKAIHERKFYAQYPEHHKLYDEAGPKAGLTWFNKIKGNKFEELLQQETENWIGEEESPYSRDKLEIAYPCYTAGDLILNAGLTRKSWKNAGPAERAGILVESLEKIKVRFFDIAYATMHTSGQSFMMAFQASGPHASDRALEAIALGYHEQMRFPEKVLWEKPMGKVSVKLNKTFRPVPKGIGLVIGCSTFPVWNTVPGLFANLVAGNPAIVKPHPRAILPIAIVVGEIQKTLKENGYDPLIVQLAVDTMRDPLTKQLAEHEAIKLIDYTGGTEFGNYIETLRNKTVFTEKAGVNPVILDSVDNLDEVMQNLAFSVSLYSGQMCTAPQNIFIPEKGVMEGDILVPYEEVVEKFTKSLKGLVNHPKMGAGTLATVQNEATCGRVKETQFVGGKVALDPGLVENEEFSEARTCTPLVMEVEAAERHIYAKELFGPIALIVKTSSTEESIQIAKDLVAEHGAITCAAYTTNAEVEDRIVDEMESVFAPVSLNLKGFIWVNQHAAFSDFHVTGGNPAGNASFTNPEFVIKRFVWVGHRKLVE